MDKKPEVCELTHLASCPCLIGSTYRNNRVQYFEFMRRWQLADIEVSNESEFDTNEFTVVPLMYTLNYTFPRTSSGDIDYSFLSEDCFHLSQKGNARCKWLSAYHLIFRGVLQNMCGRAIVVFKVIVILFTRSCCVAQSLIFIV